MKMSLPLCCALVLSLAACGATPKPDYRIKVRAPVDGPATAVQPACPPWSGREASLFDNQDVPQFGCATARNLAAMVDEPRDLVKGRQMGPADGTVGAAATEAYHEGKTKPLLNPMDNTGKSGS